MASLYICRNLFVGSKDELAGKAYTNDSGTLFLTFAISHAPISAPA